jgi:hypothetical protein
MYLFTSSGGLETEGLFRIGGSLKAIDALKQKFNKGNTATDLLVSIMAISQHFLLK